MPEAIPYKIRAIPMTGRLIEALDPIHVGENFRELKNLRPTATHKRAVGGMEKITTDALTFNDVIDRPAKIRNAIHFVKEEPYESHIVVEAYNYAENSLRLYTLDGDIPDTDTFGAMLYSVAEKWIAATAVTKGTIVFPTTYNGYHYECVKAGTTHGTTEPTWTTTPLATILDNTAVWICREGSLHGSFSLTTDSSLVYANSAKILIWPGVEHKAGAVVNASSAAFPLPDMDDMFDYTDHLQNTFTDDRNVAFITGLSYSAGVYSADVYIGSPYRINGAKFYVQNPVGYTPATQNCETAYWANGGMTAVLNTDGTKTGTKTLTQTGSVTFSSDTTALVQPALIFGRFLYWYRFRFKGVPASGANRPVVYFVTIDAPMQPLTNIWDGTPTPLLAAWKCPTTDKYIEYTTTIAEQDNVKVYIGGWKSNPSLAMNLSEFKAADRMYFGSAVRLTGLQITMSQDDRNRRAAIIRVDYFNGTAWVRCADIRDGTADTGVSLWQSGTVTWTPPEASIEFKTCVKNDVELYYYCVYWSTYLSSSDVWVDKITGIPMPVPLTGSKSAFVAQDRLFLVKENTLECSPVSRPSVINGSEHVTFTMGDESPITGGCHLFSIQGSEYYSPILVFKKTATFLLTGTGPDWKRHELSRYDGLAASDTLVVVNLPISIPGFGTTVAIGQGATGIFISDGRPPRIVSQDIEQYFDPRHADCILPENLDKSTGFMDYDLLEYHWLFLSGTNAASKEMVLNLRKMEWFEIDRGSYPLEFGFSVQDTHKRHYTYGTSSDAHVRRLEYGTSFDGDPIVCTMWSGDVALTGDPTIETKCEQVQILCVAMAKTEVPENVEYDHFLDTNIAAMNREITLAPRADGKRVANMIAKVKSPYAVFHSGRAIISNYGTVETGLKIRGLIIPNGSGPVPFEPLLWMYHYEVEQQRVKPNQADTATGRSWLYSEGD